MLPDYGGIVEMNRYIIGDEALSGYLENVVPRWGFNRETAVFVGMRTLNNVFVDF